ncbi:hypothetical protein EGW08_002721, partial [Elysia chlorotica]
MATPDQKLHKAVRENDMTTVVSLLNSGVNINCLFYGWTPLQLAIENGLQEMAIFLISKGCDTNQHDKSSKSPFEEAVVKKEAKVVEALVTNGVSATQNLSSGDSALCYAVELGCTDLVKALLNDSLSDGERERSGFICLLLSFQHQHNTLMDLLNQSTGADLNVVHIDNNNFTPLIAAVACDNEEINMADVNVQDTDGWTPLWHAYSNSNEEICELLLCAGAQTDLTNVEGKTVIQEANENEDDDFIEIFNKFKRV